METSLRIWGLRVTGICGIRRSRVRVASAEDVAAIAKELKLNRLAVWGVSGGGPHALACAALLPDLVAAAAALASPAPYASGGLDWLAGMGEDNIAEFGGDGQRGEVVDAAKTPEALHTRCERLEGEVALE